MAKLSTAQRDKMPAQDFALPGGRYPVNDASHAANAKARASQQYNKGNLSAAEKAKVDARANKVLDKKSAPKKAKPDPKKVGARLATYQGSGGY